MIGWLHRSSNQADPGVTRDAGRVGTFERAAGVTALAGYIGVSAVEIEAGAEMIEWLLCEQYRPSQQQYRKCDQATCGHFPAVSKLIYARCIIDHRIDLTLRNESAE